MPRHRQPRGRSTRDPSLSQPHWVFRQHRPPSSSPSTSTSATLRQARHLGRLRDLFPRRFVKDGHLLRRECPGENHEALLREVLSPACVLQGKPIRDVHFHDTGQHEGGRLCVMLQQPMQNEPCSGKLLIKSWLRGPTVTVILPWLRSCTQCHVVFTTLFDTSWPNVLRVRQLTFSHAVATSSYGVHRQPTTSIMQIRPNRDASMPKHAQLFDKPGFCGQYWQ